MFNNYPYTDFHELNLDWIIKEVQEAGNIVREIKSKVNEIVEDETKKAVEDYFNSVMIDAIYDESTETITLLKEVTANGQHEYDPDNTAMIVK